MTAPGRGWPRTKKTPRRTGLVGRSNHSVTQSLVSRHLPAPSAARTPRSPSGRRAVHAEEKAGDLSEADVKAVTEFMNDARKADASGVLPACRKAVADTQRVLTSD